MDDAWRVGEFDVFCDGGFWTWTDQGEIEQWEEKDEVADFLSDRPLWT